MKTKKEIILIFLILVFIIGLEYITGKFTKKVVEQISKEVDDVIDELYNKKSDYDIKKLKKDWIDKERILSFYVEHNELEKITNGFTTLEENANNEEYAQALINAREIIYWLYHFKEKDELLLKNIL